MSSYTRRIVLTKRELQVLALAAQGKTNRQIAKELGIEESTVEQHFVNICNKLGISREGGVAPRQIAILYALQSGLIPFPRITLPIEES